jgi:exopolyphosphatase/guanosine-5'-triphosphate,3'-diphosphate pyrophosphatase
MARPPGAAIDLGSTSVHLLVARGGGDGLVSVADESSFLGLGAAVDGAGGLGPEGREILVQTVAGYVAQARALGADAPIVMGTEPLRRLSDATRIVAEVSAACGVPLHVLEHEEEGLLTLVGLTGGRSVRSELVVVDIGGGSSEMVEIGPNRLAQAAGIRVGAGRLTRVHVQNDPPTEAEIKALVVAADAAFDWVPSRRPGEVIAVGGTASNLLKLLRRSRGPEDLDTLDRSSLDAVRAIVSSGPAELLAARFVMRDARIRLLAAGAAIMEVVMRRTGADSIRVADAGIREGAIIAADRAGAAWRERLEELAHGWLV